MTNYQDDPVYLDSRREAIVILCLWSVCFVWTVGYCYLAGYSEHPREGWKATALLPELTRFDRDSSDLATPFGLGIPSWVFWGIAVPWVVCIGISTWFCFCFMKDDDEVATTVGADKETGQ